jgi:hypothetical protein
VFEILSSSKSLCLSCSRSTAKLTYLYCRDPRECLPVSESIANSTLRRPTNCGVGFACPRVKSTLRCFRTGTDTRFRGSTGQSSSHLTTKKFSRCSRETGASELTRTEVKMLRYLFNRMLTQTRVYTAHHIYNTYLVA